MKDSIRWLFKKMPSKHLNNIQMLENAWNFCSWCYQIQKSKYKIFLKYGSIKEYFPKYWCLISVRNVRVNFENYYRNFSKGHLQAIFALIVLKNSRVIWFFPCLTWCSPQVWWLCTSSYISCISFSSSSKLWFLYRKVF